MISITKETALLIGQLADTSVDEGICSDVQAAFLLELELAFPGSLEEWTLKALRTTFEPV